MSSHFQGQSAFEHLKSARLKGALTSKELHGIEPSGSFSAAVDAAKETALALMFLSVLFAHFSFSLKQTLLSFLIFSIGYVAWKVGRSATLAWSSLERLHKLIEEERWEIEHHREQEREELIEMYQLKGLRGKLLDDVVQILMSDDHRLLSVMLEEELGLTIESREHPLQQALGAFIGSLASAILMTASLFLHVEFGALGMALLITSIGSYLLVKRLDINALSLVVWAFSLTLFTYGLTFFLSQLF